MASLLIINAFVLSMLIIFQGDIGPPGLEGARGEPGRKVREQ